VIESKKISTKLTEGEKNFQNLKVIDLKVKIFRFRET